MTRNRREDIASVRVEGIAGGSRVKYVLGGLLMIALCVGIRYYGGADSANAESPERSVESGRRMTGRSAHSATDDRLANEDHARSAGTRSPASQGARTPKESSPPTSSIPEVVASVNTQRITREDLARECLRHFGNEVLESMVNKQLIVRECQRQGISVTRGEVDQEIERMAKRFGIPVDQWLNLLKQERNITAAQYASDIIWPTLALRKLAGNRLTVSREELIREFETQYGERVSARLIAVSDPEKARSLQAQAAANPEEFGNLAKTYSEDAASASVKGVIQPIRKHGTYKEIEDAIFAMADGDVSPVIHVGNQYVILKRERLIEAQRIKFEDVAPRLEETLRDRKTRTVAQDVFRELQDRVKDKIVMVWNDPAKRNQMPGVAALIDDSQITMRDLADECIVRHGPETLEGMITRKILEQACKKQGIVITEADLDEEIARAALAGVKTKADGSPDVAAWLELVTKQQGMTLENYRNDAVWPSVALKKLIGGKIEVTEEDLRKGYEANFGPRVRCLAIVLNNARRAQQVFEMARKNNTSEYFGDLATQYSIEPGSQALRGEVPPIKKYGGQPELEREAFSLKPGELSGVIQVGDKFVILRCEDYTKPVAGVDFAKVRDEIFRDLHEKKLRLAMAERFESLQETAAVDNYLAGTSRSPKSSRGATKDNVPTLKQIPGRG